MPRKEQRRHSLRWSHPACLRFRGAGRENANKSPRRRRNYRRRLSHVVEEDAARERLWYQRHENDERMFRSEFDWLRRRGSVQRINV